MGIAEKPSFSKPMSIGDHAFALMKRIGIEITPITFELFFEMVSGQNPDIKRRFSELGKDMTRADLDKLCQEFLPHHYGESMLDRSYDSIRAELSTFQEDLYASRTSLSDFAGALSSTSQALTQIRNPELTPIKAQIDRVSKQTAIQQEQTGQFIERVERRINTVNSLNDELEQANKAKFTDPVTGLGNRRAFLKDLAEYYKTDRIPKGFTIVFANFLNAQSLNQPELAKLRPEILMRVAKAHESMIEQSGKGYWLDKPEGAFVIETTDEVEVTRFAKTLHDTLAREVQVLRGSARNLPLLGCVFGCADAFSGDTAGVVIRNAEQALMEARNLGDGAITHYARKLDAKGRDYALYGRQSFAV